MNRFLTYVSQLNFTPLEDNFGQKNTSLNSEQMADDPTHTPLDLARSPVQCTSVYSSRLHSSRDSVHTNGNIPADEDLQAWHWRVVVAELKSERGENCRSVINRPTSVSRKPRLVYARK